jgi:hypothetical protein
MLLAVSALTSFSCSSGFVCHGFCVDDAAIPVSDAAADDHVLLGFADVAYDVQADAVEEDVAADTE